MNVKYDWNEWVSLFSTIVIFLLFFPIRKYFHPLTTIIIWISCIAFVESIDYFLAGSPFKLYYFGDNDTYEPSTVLIHWVQYSTISLIFLYFYDKWKLRGFKLWVYILIWMIISVLYEWLLILNKVLTYSGWHLYYSIPTYPVSSLLLIGLFHFIQKNLRKQVSKVDS
jgi:hypothetical protein